MEIATICNYGGILINDKGSSSTMSGLLTKQAVLEAKSGKNDVTVNYEEIQQMTGGNFNKIGTTNMSGLLKKIKKNIGKGESRELMKMNPVVGQIQDKLNKYM
jgi:hypothetical protein